MGFNLSQMQLLNWIYLRMNLALMLGRSPSQTPPRETTSPTNIDAAAEG